MYYFLQNDYHAFTLYGNTYLKVIHKYEYILVTNSIVIYLYQLTYYTWYRIYYMINVCRIKARNLKRHVRNEHSQNHVTLIASTANLQLFIGFQLVLILGAVYRQPYKQTKYYGCLWTSRLCLCSWHWWHRTTSLFRVPFGILCCF